MNKEHMKKIFEIMEQIDDLACLTGGKEQERQDAAIAPCEDSAKNTHTETVAEPKYAGPNHDTRKRYSPEAKRLIVKLHTEEGYTFERITKEYGVSKATVTKWCSDARFENKIRLDRKDQEIQKIVEENKKIREENAFLKQIVVLLFGQGMEAKSL